MTEVEWLACANPTPMLWFGADGSGERKTRLFAVACCRRIWNLLLDLRSKSAIEAAEQIAEGLRCSGDPWSDAMNARTIQPTRKAKHAANAAAFSIDGSHLLNLQKSQQYKVVFSANVAAWEAAWAVGDEDWVPADDLTAGRDYNRTEAERTVQARLLRDIFGNPFRPVLVDPAWLTTTVAGLAQSIYDDRAFDRLPILADALEDAGCTNVDMLNHCRLPGEHVRGCWVVDLLLGKK